ncbi:MAG: MMPL family transporter [Burkholderiales bacterium]|nr:MMPL family transporter [Burkholderiales bacterium]
MNRPLRRRHRATVLGLWLALVALALVVVARAHYTADLSAFLPKSPDARQRLLITQLQSGLPSRTLLIGIEGGDAGARAAASRALAAALRSSGLFEQVQNGEREAFAELGRWLFEHRYLLSPAVTPEHFGAEGLREALGETLSLLGTPAGTGMRELLPRDPTGEMQRIAEALIPAEAPRLEGGVWVSRSAPRAVLLASTRADGADLDAQQAAIERVRAAFATAALAVPPAATTVASTAPSTAPSAAARPAPPPGAPDAAPGAAHGLVLRLSGAPVLGVRSRALIEQEVHWLAIAGTAVMAALLLAAFASPRALAAAVLPVGSGVLAGIAAVALGFGQVHGMTLGFGATLVGEAVDYAIYYLVQARPGPGPGPGNQGEGWRHWLRSGWPTVRLGLWTSICGFAALVFSGFPGLAQLGVFSIAGLAGAALTTRWLLPVLLPDGAPGVGLRRHLGGATARALAWLPRLRRAMLMLGAAALVLLVQRADLWRADLAALSPLPPEALALDAALRADLGASDARTLVVVQGADAETTLQRTEAAAARLETLVEKGQLGGFDTVTRFLPSRATQEQRLASLPDPAALPAALAFAVRGTPIEKSAPTLLAPFVGEIERARATAPLTPEVARSGPAKPLVDALLLRPAPAPYRSGGTEGTAVPHTALLPLQAASMGAQRGIDAAALAAALQGLPGTQVLDVKLELDTLYQRYLREALWQAVIGAAAVVVLVAAALRSARRTLAVCQPLALAVLLALAGMALAGVTLGILHLVGLLLVVAVGSNYALFFDQSFGQSPDPSVARALPGGSADPDTLASLLLANLTTVASFGLLAFSQIPALSAIGRVVAPGAFLALLLAAVFARPAQSERVPGSAPRSM